MAKSNKKLSNDLLLAPVKVNKVEEREDEKSVGTLLDELSGELKNQEPEVQTVAVNEVVESLKTPSNMEELLGALGDIDKEFENKTDRDYYPDNLLVDIPNSLNLEKMKVPEIEEDKLREEIEKTQKSKVETEKDNLTKKTQTQKAQKEAEIEAKKESYNVKKEEIGKIYDDYRTSVESDALKRGLARSSVALLSLEGVESSRAKELSDFAGNLTLDINKLEEEIVALQDSLDSSLEKLDLELADNVNKELAEKIKDLEEKRAEAIEFNNKVNQMEAEYQMKRLSKVDEAQALEEELAKKYEGYALADKREQKVQTAMSYFNTMDKYTALGMIISNPDLATALGDAYYDIYYYTMRR